MTPVPALHAEGIVAHRGEQRILDHVSLQLRPGDIFAIVGPNGSGKTTLLHALAGLLSIESGQVFLNGQPLAEFKPRQRARRLAIAVQVPTFPSQLTVADLVALGRTPHRVGARQRRNPSECEAELIAVRSAIHDVGMNALVDRRLDSLSGGEKRRAHLARVLAQQTQIMLFDEPTTHLDSDSAERLLDTLQKRALSGAAIVIATHDQGLASRRCSRVFRLGQGQLQFLAGAA